MSPEAPSFAGPEELLPAVRQGSLALLLTAALSMALQVALFIALLPAARNPARRPDFVNMFNAATLVWSGSGTRIYQTTVFNHLPCEALALSPLASLGYGRAYLTFLGVNALLLVLALRKLQIGWQWTFAACAFMPVGIAMVNGQDSIFTLFALSAGAAQLATGGELAAGAWLGLTLYKPQIGIPICGLMFLWRRWRFVAGFLATAGVCVAASIATVGLRGFISYIELLRSMQAEHGIVNWGAAGKYRMIVSNMVGFRGLLSFALSGRALLIISVALSIALLGYTFLRGRGMRAHEQLTLATAACCLANYHMLPSDLVIILVPLAVCWRSSSEGMVSWVALAVVGVAAVLPFIPQSLMAIPLLLFFFAFARSLERRTGVAMREGSLIPAV